MKRNKKWWIVATVILLIAVVVFFRIALGVEVLRPSGTSGSHGIQND